MNMLITGCGRSGTKWMAAVLRSFGFNLLHERVGQDGMVSWYVACRKMIEDKAYTNKEMLPNPIIFHQTREPLACISSIYRVFKKPAMEYATRHMQKQFPKMPEHKSRLEWTMLYWLYWNKLAEKDAAWQYKVEDVTGDNFFKIFCEKIKVPYKNAYIIGKWPKKARNYKRAAIRKDRVKKITWDTLSKINTELTQKIVLQGKRYGYRIE